VADSRIAVYGAMAANVAIAVTKFIVATATGSSAMLSEAIHSTVDTCDSVLLLVGLARSKRKPSLEHPFGHGKELYFWTLIVAVLIFGLGGGLSIYEGVLHVLHPVPLENAKWNYIVLGAAALFESVSLVIGLRAFFRDKGDMPFWEALRTSKDPTTYTVITEDTAAIIGLAFAAIGVYASHRLDMPRIDGGASIAIGLLLAGVAVVLISESRSLLIGEGVRIDTAKSIRNMALSTQGVVDAALPRSMYLGPEAVLLTLDVAFDPALGAQDIATAVQRIEKGIRERYPRIKRIYVEAQHPGSTALSDPLSAGTSLT
jgi:cation diffusion facilitator family transporter